MFCYAANSLKGNIPVKMEFHCHVKCANLY